MSKETEYKAQIESMGLWQDAFAGAVHDLCMLERDQAKTRTAWRAALAAENVARTELLFDLLMQQDQKIQALRESLCLTPRALQKLRKDFGSETAAVSSPDTKPPISMIDQIRKRREA